MGVLMLKSQLQILKNSQNSYKKPHLSFEEQVEHLKSCGLNIHNEAYAIKKLSTINYYRLSAYYLTFKSYNSNRFYPNTEFRTIIRLYDFDRHLRHILFGAVEVIEVYLRTQIAYWHTKEYGAFGYLEKDNFDCDDKDFDNVIDIIENESKRSDDWIHSLTIVRNISAHHSRLWNKQLRIPFKVPNKNRLFQPIAKITKKIKGELREFNNNGSTFFTIFVLKYMLDRIGEEVEFKNLIEELLNSYPEVNLKAMGFIKGWQKLDIWEEINENR